MPRSTALTPFLALFLACSDSKVGAPCDEDAQCGGDLVCDVHDGKGTCQPAHGHESGSETHGATDGHATTDHEIHDHASSTSHGHTTGDATTGDATTGGLAAACTDDCACLEITSTAGGPFPHADLAACADFTAA